MAASLATRIAEQHADAAASLPGDVVSRERRRSAIETLAVEGLPTTREAAMAKMTATESAQAVIDRAVQMFGGRGVRSGEMVEKLYREIRALRIYEGATEVQRLIVAREILKGEGG